MQIFTILDKPIYNPYPAHDEQLLGRTDNNRFERQN